MEANKILQSDLLDIIFEGRNKSYGAYELRLTYNKRIKQSVIAMGGVCLLFITGILLANSGGKKVSGPLIIAEVSLVDIVDKEKEKTIPEPEKPKPIQKTIADTPPIILPDQEVPKTEVPTQDAVENVAIGTQTKDGVDSGDFVAPPVETSTGQTELPATKKDYEDNIDIVQIEAKFPGGVNAWKIYIERNLNTNTPVDNGAAAGNYTVVVSFVVDKDGNISDVKALNDPGYGTADEAIRVIKKSKQWTPALQNGRNVTYRQKQSITFMVSES